MEVRATVWVATAGVLAGELAAPGLSPPVLFGVACALAIVWLAGRRRSAAVAWIAVAAMALGVGAQRMSVVQAPEFPPDHVGRSGAVFVVGGDAPMLLVASPDAERSASLPREHTAIFASLLSACGVEALAQRTK